MLVGIGVFVVALLGMYLLRQPLFGDLVARRVSAVLSEALGVPVRVDRVLGTWVTNARVEHITLDTESDLERGVLDSFEADSIVVHFSLWQILSGNVVGAIKGVEAENLRLRVDFTRGSPEESGEEKEPTSLAEVVAAVPPRFPHIDVHARLEALTGFGEVLLENLRVKTTGDRMLSLDAEEIVLPDRAGEAGAFHARIRRVATGLVWESESEFAGLRLAKIDLAEDGRLEAEGTFAGAEIALSLDGQQASVRTGSLQLAKLPPWVLRLIPDPGLRPTAGRVALFATAMSLDPLEATAELEGSDVVLPSEVIRSLRLRASVADDVLTLHDGSLQARSTRVEAREVVFDFGQGSLGIASLKRLRIHADDLGTWLGELDRPLVADLDASSLDGRNVVLHGLVLTGEGVSLRAEGTLVAPIDLDAWAESEVALSIRAHAEDARLGGLDIGGRLALEARVAGTLQHPLVDGTLRGEGITLDGRHVSLIDVAGRYDGDVLDVARLVLESEPARIDGEARLRFDPLEVESSRIAFDVSDLEDLQAILPDIGLPMLSGALRGEIQLRGNLDAIVGGGSLASDGLVVDGFAIDNLRVALEGRGSALDVASLEARGLWGHVAATGTYDARNATATLRTLAGRYESYDVVLLEEARVSFGERSAVDGLVAEALGGRVEGSIAWAPAFRADVRFEAIDLARLWDEIDGAASGALLVTEEVQELELLVPALRYKEHVGRVDVAVRQDASGIHLARLDVDAGDSLRISGRGRLPIRVGTGGGIERLPVADARFELAMSSEDLSVWLPLPVRRIEVQASGEGDRIEAHVRLPKFPAFAEIDPLELVVVHLQADTEGAQLEARLEEDARAEATLELRTTTGWRWSDPGDTPKDFNAIEVEGTIRARVPDATAIVPFLPEELVGAKGSLDAEFTISGPLGWPRVEGLVEGTGVLLELRDVPLPVAVPELRVRLEDGELHIVKARLAYGSAEATAAGQLVLPTSRNRGWTGQKVAGEASLNVPELSVLNDVLRDLAPLSGSLHGAIDVTGTLSDPEVEGTVVGDNLSLHVAAIDQTVQVPIVRLRYVDDRLTVEEATILADDARVELSGWIDLKESARLEEAPLEARIRAELPTLAVLERFVPDLDGIAGAATVDATVSGSLAEPTLGGSIVLSNLAYSLDDLDVTLRVERAEVRAEAGRLVIEDARVALGTGTARVGGSLGIPPRLDGDWLDQPLDARVVLDIADLDWLGEWNEDLGRIDGEVRGTIEARGTLEDPVLTGAIELNRVGGRLPGSFPSLDGVNGRIELVGRRATIPELRGALGRSPFTLGGTVDWPEGGPPTLDLRLAGDNLLLMRTRDLRLRADVDVRAHGRLDNLLLEGDVRVADALYVATTSLLGGGGPATAGEGFQLFSIADWPLSTMRFDVRVRADETIRVRTNVFRGDVSANVRLAGTGAEPALVGSASFPDMLVKLPFSSLKVARGEARFDEADPTRPFLEAEARTEMKGYELVVQVRGRLPDVDIRVASTPPLSQNEAILLLTTGATGEELRRDGLARAALTRVGTVFANSLLSGGDRGPDDPDKQGFFDRFTFTQGREVSRSGRDTLEVEFSLTDNFFLRVERDRYDHTNAGVVWRWRFR